MSESAPTGPRHLHAFVHFDGTVTLTDPLHGDAMYTRGDIVDELLAALKDARKWLSERGRPEMTVAGAMVHGGQIKRLDAAIAKAEGAG